MGGAVIVSFTLIRQSRVFRYLQRFLFGQVVLTVILFSRSFSFASTGAL